VGLQQVDTAASNPNADSPPIFTPPSGSHCTRDDFTDGTGDQTLQLGRAPARAGRNQIMDEPEGVVADDKLLLRIEEAAKRLGIGRSLMYRLVLSGQVQSVPLGRLRRIPAEALREYVERLRVEASGKSPARS
jgi:excisionase family DNA binding protein